MLQKVKEKDTDMGILVSSRKMLYTVMEMGSLYGNLLLNHANVRLDEKKTVRELTDYLDNKLKRIKNYHAVKYGIKGAVSHDSITDEQTSFMLDIIELTNLVFDDSDVRKRVLSRFENLVKEENGRLAKVAKAKGLLKEE